MHLNQVQRTATGSNNPQTSWVRVPAGQKSRTLSNKALLHKHLHRHAVRLRPVNHPVKKQSQSVSHQVWKLASDSAVHKSVTHPIKWQTNSWQTTHMLSQTVRIVITSKTVRKHFLPAPNTSAHGSKECDEFVTVVECNDGGRMREKKLHERHQSPHLFDTKQTKRTGQEVL